MSNTDCLTTIENELQNDYRERKLYARHLYNSYKRLAKNCTCDRCDFESRYYNVKDCASFLDFGHYKSGAVKLNKADFCKDRLCPMCAWRRSMKLYSQVYSCVDFLQSDYQFIFLTLTVINVTASELSDKIDEMNKSFAKMLKYKAFKRICKGYIKSMEITYNRVSDTFHPHFHILLAVDKNYFKSDYYLHQSDYLNMWRKATKDDRIFEVDVRKVYGKIDKNTGGVNICKAVAEVTKYTVKPNDYIFSDNKVLTDKLVYTFSKVLFNRRMLSWGGVFSDTRDILGLNKKSDDILDGDLLNINNDSVNGDILVSTYRYRWVGGKYKLYDIEYSKDFLVADFIDFETGEVLQE